jgi:hypothetical protein
MCAFSGVVWERKKGRMRRAKRQSKATREKNGDNNVIGSGERRRKKEEGRRKKEERKKKKITRFCGYFLVVAAPLLLPSSLFPSSLSFLPVSMSPYFILSPFFSFNETRSVNVRIFHEVWLTSFRFHPHLSSVQQLAGA